MLKLNSKQLRKSKPTEEQVEIARKPICLVLDRIIDTYNTGSLFRLSDATAIEKVYLCGEMEFPPSSKIHKSAVGTENWVPWEKTTSTLETVKILKGEGKQIIAVEQSPKSIQYSEINQFVQLPCAIVVGNETEGLPQEVLEQADIIVELPMLGVNKSFNVWGSAAVVVYKILEKVLG